jgi:two-component system chemotaxis response regulator CheB
VSATAGSILASILDRASPLDSTPGRDGEPMERGHIYVAPPDCHLLVEGGAIALSSGPRENGHRPAVDPLFRSAAEAFGPRACGVVLSGTRDDGTAGLAAIKAAGGATIVQDPDDALYPGMPESAMAHVGIDAVLPATRIGAALAQLVSNGSFPPGTKGHPAPMPDHSTTHPTSLICPECGGSIAEHDQDGVTVLSCHVGHHYGVESFVAEQADATERALWTAIRALEDRATMLRRMAEQFNRRGVPRSAATFAAQAAQAKSGADSLRETIVRFSSTLRRAPAEDEDATEGVA